MPLEFISHTNRMIARVVTYFLMKNPLKAYSARQINDDINSELSHFTMLQIYQKRVSTFLCGNETEYIKTIEQNGTIKYGFSDKVLIDKMVLREVRNDFKDMILEHEIILKNVLKVLCTNPSKFNPTVIRKQIDSISKPTRSDVKLVLWGALRGLVHYDNKTFSYRLTDLCKAKKILDDLNHLSLEHEIFKEQNEFKANELISKGAFSSDYGDQLLAKRKWLNGSAFDKPILEQIDIVDGDKRKSLPIINNNLRATRINDKRFKLVEIHALFHPLFGFELDRTTGDYLIILNTAHKSYSDNARQALVDIAAAMYSSKLSMTDPNIGRFIERINNHIDLVEHE